MTNIGAPRPALSHRLVVEVSATVKLFHDLLGLAIEKKDADFTRTVLKLDFKAAGEIIHALLGEAADVYLRVFGTGAPRSEMDERELSRCSAEMTRLNNFMRRCNEVEVFTISYSELTKSSIPELLEILAEHPDE